MMDAREVSESEPEDEVNVTNVSAEESTEALVGRARRAGNMNS